MPRGGEDVKTSTRTSAGLPKGEATDKFIQGQCVVKSLLFNLITISKHHPDKFAMNELIDLHMLQ